MNHIADGISSFPCSFEHLLRLGLANLFGDFCELLQDNLKVKPLHFLAIQDRLTRNELVVDGGLGPIRTHDPAALTFMLVTRGHSLYQWRHSGDLLTQQSEQVSV